MKCFMYLIILFSFSMSAINLNLPNSAVENATSGLLLIYTTPASAAANPAIMSTGLESSATYLLGMQDLPFYNVHFVCSFHKFHLHLGQSYLDHEFYKESNSQLSISYKWHSLTAGAGIHLLRNKATNYHDASTYLFNGGIRWENEKFKSALAVQNFTQSKFLETDLPLNILWETCYDISTKSVISLGLEKQDDFDFSFKFAAKYQPFQMLTLLAGYQFEPDRIGIGTIFSLKKLNFIYSVRTHQYLDLSHYITINYELQD